MNVEINGRKIGTVDEVMFQVRGDPWITVIQEVENRERRYKEDGYK